MARLPLRALMTHMITVNCRTAFHLAIAVRPAVLASDRPTVTLPPFRELVRGIDHHAGNAQRRGPPPPVPPPTVAPSRPRQRTTSLPAPPPAPATRAPPAGAPKLQASSREDWRGMTQLTVAVGPDGAWHCPVPECTRSYMSYGAVQTHHKRAHTDGKPYSCKFGCDARFAYEDELAEHIKTHPVTPDWPFVCGCGRRYKKYSSLYCHVKASAMSQCKAVH
ncbi:hypothetical protein AURDEDRAFT_116764 [Auricularia subglabra TFB-10046 SS5]|uniref:C2H2-type domain-containing protein n=1 Tax=Auricularia subglabra (strain TFB-10046 / SS5) TaxID=717982 RepID=J0WUE7_AURST|nr:hypothetical protein AURDEDRAFT_116764 [Auricularia subglabra TFB-10046 SS5]